MSDKESISARDARIKLPILGMVTEKHAFYTCDNPDTTIAHGGTFAQTTLPDQA